MLVLTVNIANAQADFDPDALSNECLIQIVDPIDNLPIIGAHICIEFVDVRKVYEVSDSQGEAVLLYGDVKAGSVAISSIGFVTTYMQLNSISEGAIIPVKADVFDIDQVVVTISARPTPVDSSIYKVKLICDERLKHSGSVNLGELLLNEANIRIENDLVLGSQIDMLGMSGQNVKVMIDGVPVIGRLDGNVDLSQINLANVKQVEVIEGPMSVVYGNNALAGTINIITKNIFYHQLSGQANAFVESVGRYTGNACINQHLVNTSYTDYESKRLIKINL